MAARVVRAAVRVVVASNRSTAQGAEAADAADAQVAGTEAREAMALLSAG